MKLFLMIGPPLSGKGTQCSRVAFKIDIKHVSTGDVLRKHITQRTDLGKKVEKFILNGDIVPEHFILDILTSIIQENTDASKIIIDGFPRTIKQVDLFLNYIKSLNINIACMIRP